MSIFKTILVTAMGFGSAMPAVSADFSDPTWPCVQRKVENLSLGLMWPFPVEDTQQIKDETLRQEAHDLADAFALRRIALEELRPQASSLAESADGDPAILGQVFARSFTTLNKRRSRIISGIGDFSLSQISLADQIEGARVEMTALMKSEDPDFDRVDVLEEQLDWDQIIHSDRQRSIQYLCESPVLIERRLFGIAQMLQQLVKDEE